MNQKLFKTLTLYILDHAETMHHDLKRIYNDDPLNAVQDYLQEEQDNGTLTPENQELLTYLTQLATQS